MPTLSLFLLAETFVLTLTQSSQFLFAATGGPIYRLAAVDLSNLTVSANLLRQTPYHFIIAVLHNIARSTCDSSKEMHSWLFSESLCHSQGVSKLMTLEHANKRKSRERWIKWCGKEKEKVREGHGRRWDSEEKKKPNQLCKLAVHLITKKKQNYIMIKILLGCLVNPPPHAVIIFWLQEKRRIPWLCIWTSRLCFVEKDNNYYTSDDDLGKRHRIGVGCKK